MNTNETTHYYLLKAWRTAHQEYTQDPTKLKRWALEDAAQKLYDFEIGNEVAA